MKQVERLKEYNEWLDIAEEVCNARSKALYEYSPAIYAKLKKKSKKGWSKARVQYYVDHAQSRITYKATKPYLIKIFNGIDALAQRMMTIRLWESYNQMANIKDIDWGEVKL